MMTRQSGSFILYSWGKYHVISSSYPNLTLSNIELYASNPYDRAKEALKVIH